MTQADASNCDWGAFCKGVLIGSKWSEKEKSLYINLFELIAAKIAILKFAKGLTNITLH